MLQSIRAKQKWPQFIASIAVSLGALTQGVVVGWTSSAIPFLQGVASPVGDDPMSDDEISWLGSVTYLGSLVATPFYSHLANNGSRKTTGYLIGLPAIIGWLIVIHAQSEVVLFITRFLLGCVGAGTIILCPLYITEIAEDKVRGMLGTYVQMSFYSGVLLSYCVGSYMSYTSFGWFCLSIPVVSLLIFSKMPESPVYLLKKNQENEARKALRWLRGTNVLAIEDEIKKIKSSLAVNNCESTFKPTFTDLVATKAARKAMLISFGLVVNSIVCGSFAILTFAGNILEESCTGLPSHVPAIITTCLQLGGIIPASFLIDRVGRRLLLMLSNIGLSFSLAIFGLYYFLKNHGYPDINAYGWLPVLTLCIYFLSLNIGVSTIPYIVMNEVLPPNIKSLATSVNYCVFWAGAFISTKFFIGFTKHVGTGRSYWIFAALCLIAVLFGHFIVPETKNKSLESIFEDLDNESVGEGKPAKAEPVVP